MPHNNNHSSDLEYQSGACANQANYQGNTYYRHIQQAEEPYVRQEGCPDTSLAHLQGAGQDGDGDGEKARSGGARSTDNWRRQHTAPPPSGNRRRSYSSPISSPTTSASSARGYNNQTKRNPPPPPMARPVRQDAWNQRDVQRRDGQPQAPPPPPPAAAPRDRALTRSATHEPPQRRPPPRKRSPKTPPRRYAQGGAQRAATADPDQTYRNDRSYSDDYPPRRSYSNPSDQGASSRRQRSDRGRHAAQQRSRPRTPERANRNDRSYSNHNDSRSGGASSRRSRGKPQRYRDDYEDDRRRTPERRRHSYSNSSRYSRDSESRGASSRYQTRSRSDRRPTPRDRNRHPVKDEPSYRNDYSYSDDGYPIRRTYSDEEVSRSHGASTSSRQQPASRSSRPSASSRRQPQDRSRRYTPEESVASGYRERRGPDDDAPQRQQQQQHQQQKRGNRQLTPSDLGSVSEIRACEEDDEFRQNRSRGEASANSPSAARPAPAPRQPAPAKPSTRARPSSLLRITLLSCTHLPARPYRDWKDDDLLKETVPNFTLYFESSNGFRHKTRLQPYRSTMYFSDEVFRCPNTAHGEEITLTVTAAVRSPEKSIRIGVAVLYVGNRRKGTQLFTAPVVSQSGTERAKERGVVQLTICEDASEDLRRTKAVLTVEEEAQLNQRLHYHLLSRQPCDLHRLEVFMGHCRGSPLDESGEVLEKHGVVMPNEEGHGRESYAYRRQRTNNHGNATPEQAHPKQQQQEQERKTRGRQQPEEDPSQRAAEPREYREESAPVVYTTRSRQSKRGNVVIVRPIQVRDLVNPDGAPRSSELTSCSLFLTLADRPYPEDVPATKVVDGLDGGGIDNLTYFRGAAKCFGDQPIELPWTPEARMEKCVEVRVHVGASRKEPLLGMCLVSLRHLLPGEPTGKMECTLVQDFGTDRATVCGIVELDLCLLLTPESRRADRTKPKEAEQHRRGQIRNSLLLFLWRYRRDKLHELDPLLDDAAISDYNHFLRELSAFGEQPPFAAVTVRCRRWYPICRSTDSAIVKEPKEQRRLAFTRESVTEANRIEAEQAKEGEQRYPYNGSGRANSLSSEDGEEHGDGRGTSRRLYVAISTGLFYSRGAATTVVNEAEHERKEREEGRVPDPLAKTKEDKASYPLDQSFQLSYVVASDDVITLTLFEEGAGAGGTVDRELGRVTVPLSVLSTGEPQPLVRLPLVMHAGRRGAFAQGAMEVDLHPEGHGFRPSVWPGWDLTLPLRVRLATILYRLASEQLHRLAVIQSTMPNDRELADPHLNRLAKLYTRPQARPQLSLALLGVRGLQKGRYYIKVEHGEDQLFRLKKLEVPDNGTGEVDLRDKRHEVILVNLLDVHHLALRVKVGQAYTLSRNVHVGSASLSAAIASFSDAPNFCEVWVPLFDEGNESITCFVGLSLAYLEQRENGTAIVDHRRRHVPTSAESLRMVDVAQRNVASLLRSYTPSLLQDVHPFVTQFMDPRTAHASMRHVMLRRPIAATAYVKVHALHMLDVDSLPEPFVPEKRILRITARFGDACVASAEHHSFIITPRESSSQGIYRDPFNPLGFMCLRLDIPESVRESTSDAPLLIVLEARGKPKEPSPYASPYVEEEKEPVEPPIELGRAALSLRALLTPEVQQQQQQQQGFITVPVVSGCATDASGRAPPAEAPYYRVPPQQKNGRWFVVADLSLSVHAADAEVEPIPSWLRLAPPLPKVMPSTQQVRESLEKQDTSRLRDLHFDLFERRLTEYAQREEAERAAAARESEGRRQRRQAEEMPTSSYPPRSKHNGQQEEHPQDTSTQRMRNNTSAGADVSRSRGGQGTPPPVSRYDQSSKYPNTSMEISSVTNNHSYTQQLDTTPQLRY